MQLCQVLLLALSSSAASAAPAAPWWQRGGQTVSPLLVPSDLAKLAQPIWAPPAPPAAPAPPGGCAFKDGLDCINDDFKKINGSATDLTQEACCRLCHADPQCKVAVLVPNWHPGISLCELKSACSQPSAAAGRLKCCLPGDESCSSTASPQPQFAMARAEFNVSSTALKSAVAFVTAQQSPFAQPDTRLATTDLDGDYGASIPSGGSSQARLLGAYKLHVNGIVVGVGPGRRVNQTQGVDAIDILSALRPGDANAVGIQGFHTSRFKNDDPRLLFLLKLEYTDGTSQTVGSGAGCQALAADHIFNPDSSQGAWAGGKCAGPTCSGMPQENLKLQHYPFGWSSPGFAGTGWSAATVAKPFVLPLQNRPARPVAVYERTPLSVTPWTNESCTRCFLVDFGRELQGGVNLTFECNAPSCSAGHRVTLLLSEELTATRKPLVPMRTGNNFSSVWTLKAGTQSGVMQHEYDEFRYALVMNAPHPMTMANAKGWVLRGMTSDDPADQYGDIPTLAPSVHRRPTAVATFSSDSVALNQVWELVRHTLVACGGLDIDVDSNTRQRDFCATDAFITGLGQLAISSDYGVAGMTSIDGFQIDSNIWQGMTDFRSALISLSYYHALYTGDVSLVRQRWEDIKKHSFVYYFDQSLGLVNKPPAFMGSQNCKCPESWSPAGLPPGVFEATHCTCTDLNDWPPQYQDGYKICNVSTVANAYISLAARRVADIALMLGETAEADHYANVSETILTTMREKLYNSTTGTFSDGLNGPSIHDLTQSTHSAIQSIIFPMMAGVANETAQPGMGLAITNALKLRLKGGVGPSSCMAAFWMLQGLYRVGWETREAADLALEVMTAEGQFSWRNMLDQGATCTMETWPSGTAPGSGGTGGTWSHPWCAGPNSAIIRLLLGVQPIEAGWTRFQIAPQPSMLKTINASVPFVLGGTATQVILEISQTTRSITVSISIPAGTVAEVCLPAPQGAEASDMVKMTLDGKPVAAVARGRMMCLESDVVAGAHVVARA